MNIEQSYDGLNEEAIRKMTHEELIQAVLNMFRLTKMVKAEDYIGDVVLPDAIADAFRYGYTDPH